MRMRFLLLGAFAFLSSSLALAADWPGWRGPDRSGVSSETGLLKTWPKNGPPLAWSFKNAGLGFSSFAVVDGVAYTLGSRGPDEIILALDAKKGAELWTAKIGPVFTFNSNTWGDGPRSTPSIAGKLLYALGGQGDLVCVDISAQGKEVWRKNLIRDLGGEMMTEWGYSEAPLVDGNLLICTPGGSKGTVAALDRKTGDIVWHSKGITNKAPYSSPVVAEMNGVRQYIQTSYISSVEGGVISGFAHDDGRVLFTTPLFKGQSYLIAPTPVVKDDLVYDTSTGGCHLFQITGGPKAEKANDLYPRKNQKLLKSGHGGVVLVGDHLYGHSQPGAWMCQDFKTGNIAWSERNELNAHSGSLTSAEGLLYLYSDSGEAGLVEANPKAFTLVSSFTIPQRSAYPANRKTSKDALVWSHPVIADGHLYLRDAELIFCYDIRAKK